MVVAVNRLEQKSLSLSAVDCPQGDTDVIQYPAKQGLVQIPLHRAGDHRLGTRGQRSNSKKRELLRLWRPGLGKQRIWQRHTALDQKLCLGQVLRHLDAGAFGIRLEQ